MYALSMIYLCVFIYEKGYLKSLHCRGRENLKLLAHPPSFVRYGNKPAKIKVFYEWTESNAYNLLCNLDQYISLDYI